jgi:hypothetical protein
MQLRSFSRLLAVFRQVKHPYSFPAPKVRVRLLQLKNGKVAGPSTVQFRDQKAKIGEEFTFFLIGSSLSVFEFHNRRVADSLFL